MVAFALCWRSISTAPCTFFGSATSVRLNTIVPAFSIWLLKNSPKFFIYIRHLLTSTTVTALFNITSISEATFFTAFITSDSLPTPDGSMITRSGWYLVRTSSRERPKSPTREQQIQPEFISRISMPASFKKPPSMPICPNSFSIRTTFSPEIASFKSCLINVVFPAPRKPEIISIFVILLTFFSVQMCTDCKSLSARYLASRQCIALHRPNLPKFRSATYYFTQIPSKVKHRQNPVTGRV